MPLLSYSYFFSKGNDKFDEFALSRKKNCERHENVSIIHDGMWRKIIGNKLLVTKKNVEKSFEKRSQFTEIQDQCLLG